MLRHKIIVSSALAASALLAAACTSAPKNKTPAPAIETANLASPASPLTAAPSKPSQQAGTLAQNVSGPSISGMRSEPRVIELTSDYQPMHPSEVLANVSDPGSRITQVLLRFEGIPMEIPMENLGGYLWRAELTQRQLEVLAVHGQTVRYEARIVATNAEGQETRTDEPVDVQVKTPDRVPALLGNPET